jgi:tRNA(Arg) A34 adenosine deaminase TadA
MCAGAISHARIGRVVWAADDPKGGAVLHGPRLFEQPTCHWRPATEWGLLAEEASSLLKSFTINSIIVHYTMRRGLR